MDGGQRNWRGEDWQKLQKNTKTDKKKYNKTPKQKPEWRRRGMRRRDRDIGSRDIK
jgi:hypothetical protein